MVPDAGRNDNAEENIRAGKDKTAGTGGRVINLKDRKGRMWILKYLTCLIGNHNCIDIIWRGSTYQYCLWFGEVKPMNTVTETVLVENQPLKGK